MDPAGRVLVHSDDGLTIAVRALADPPSEIILTNVGFVGHGRPLLPCFLSSVLRLARNRHQKLMSTYPASGDSSSAESREYGRVNMAVLLLPRDRRPFRPRGRVRRACLALAAS